MDNSALLTVKQVAERLGMSTYKVYRRIIRGDIKAQQARTGNVYYLVDPADLQEYIAAGEAHQLTPATHDRSGMMRVSEVARLTGFTTDTVRRMCYAGRLPYVKGEGERGHLRIPRQAVEEMLGAPK